MDLQRNDDQELFGETTRRFLESTCPVATVRQWAEKEPSGYPSDWWQRGAELGWTSLLVAEADGGGSVSGHGLLDLVLVAEELGRLVSPGPVAAGQRGGRRPLELGLRGPAVRGAAGHRER